MMNLRILSRKAWHKSILSFLLLITLILVNSPASVQSASTITVTNTNDSGPGSLRQAVIDATSGDTINFSVTGTIVLSTGEIEINKNLTIDGPGTGSLTIDANGASQIFRTTSGVTASISDMTIREGTTAIYNYQATLYIDNCIFSENGTTTGGGIRTREGSLYVTNSEFNSNSTTMSGGNGAGIYVDDGSVYTSVVDSDFIGNSTYGVGGAIHHRDGTLVIDGCTFNNNESTEYHGGALHIWDGTATVNGSTFSNNDANKDGGAIYLVDGTTSITDSTISGNTAQGGSGGG
jgi:predicted outer membrane repeat protein